jgi:hypothetical protein
MSNINDGGPAFPFAKEMEKISGLQFSTGMTLRDWFAGQALAGLLAQPAEPEFGAHYFAMSSYFMADAMIKAREVKP